MDPPRTQALGALRELLRECYDSCIVSCEEWRHMRDNLYRGDVWDQSFEDTLFKTAVIDVPAEEEMLLPVSNIPDILARGRGDSVTHLIINAAGGADDAGARMVYERPEALVGMFTRAPLSMAFVSPPPTRLVEALCRLVEVAVFAMPNLQIVLTARAGSRGYDCVPESAFRHISYCASAVGGPSPEPATLSIAPGCDVYFGEVAQHRDMALPLVTRVLDYIQELPLPPPLQLRLDGFYEQPDVECAHAMDDFGLVHVRRHLFFVPGVRFATAGGDTRVYDMCQIILDEEL